MQNFQIYHFLSGGPPVPKDQKWLPDHHLNYKTPLKETNLGLAQALFDPQINRSQGLSQGNGPGKEVDIQMNMKFMISSIAKDTLTAKNRNISSWTPK